MKKLSRSILNQDKSRKDNVPDNDKVSHEHEDHMCDASFKNSRSDIHIIFCCVWNSQKVVLCKVNACKLFIYPTIITIVMEKGGILLWGMSMFGGFHIGNSSWFKGGCKGCPPPLSPKINTWHLLPTGIQRMMEGNVFTLFTIWGGTPSQLWDGYPPRLRMEYPPDLGLGTQPPDMGLGTPPRPGNGYPPGPGMGYPPTRSGLDRAAQWVLGTQQQCASCVHTGGLSCFVDVTCSGASTKICFQFRFNFNLFQAESFTWFWVHWFFNCGMHEQHESFVSFQIFIILLIAVYTCNTVIQTIQ